MLVKMASSVEARFTITYILGIDTYQYSHRQSFTQHSVHLLEREIKETIFGKTRTFFLTYAANIYVLNMF